MTHMEDDIVFKALADETRRRLLDLLSERDGQTLSELCAQAAQSMTRFGCMKHLQVLEEAGLVTTRKVGREKLHYLNPIPIQQVYDRWVSKYAQPWTRSLSVLKHVLEESAMSEKPSHVFRIYIRTTPEQLWRALTDGAMTELYYFGTRVESSWQVGAPYHYVRGDGSKMIDGEVLESQPPHRLVTSFNPLWETSDAPPSRVTFEIEPQGDVCKLTLTHEGAHAGQEGIIDGWTRIVSSLKTLLETEHALAYAP